MQAWWCGLFIPTLALRSHFKAFFCCGGEAATDREGRAIPWLLETEGGGENPPKAIASSCLQSEWCCASFPFTLAPPTAVVGGGRRLPINSQPQIKPHPPLLPRLLLSLNCFPSRLAFASQLRMVKLNTPQHVHRRSRNFSSSPDCVEVSVCDLCWPCSDLFQSRCGKLKHKRAYNFFMLNIISYQTGKTVILHQQCLLFILNVPPPPAIAPDRFERDRVFFGGASDCVEHRTQCGEHVCASPLC